MNSLSPGQNSRKLQQLQQPSPLPTGAAPAESAPKTHRASIRGVEIIVPAAGLPPEY